jgi:peptide/nickel transport system substrate-binding protein
MAALAIMPKHLLEGSNDWLKSPIAQHPVGTGPFKFVEGSWTPESFTLEANPDYFLGRPYLDKIVQVNVPSMSSMYAEVENGELDAGYEPPPYTDVARLKTVPELTVLSVPAAAENAIALKFNLNKTPFDSLQVRQAILYAIDRNDLNMRALADVGAPARGPYCPSTFWAADPNVTYPGYDPAMAERLLDGAGYPRGADGTRFKMRFLVHTLWPELEIVATVLKDQLSKVGIDVTGIDLMDWLTVMDLRAKGQFDATVDIDYMVPDPSVYAYYYSPESKTGDYIGWEVPGIVNQLRMGLSSTDRAIRKTYYSDIQKLLLQYVPQIYLLERWFVFVTNSKFHDFYWEPQIDSYRFDFTHVWWEEGTAPITTATMPPAASTTTSVPPVVGFDATTVAAIAIVVAIVAFGIGAAIFRRKKPQ